MRLKFQVISYRSSSLFEIGIQHQYDQGYSLHSWQKSETEFIVAVFVSHDVVIELSKKLASLADVADQVDPKETA